MVSANGDTPHGVATLVLPVLFFFLVIHRFLAVSPIVFLGIPELLNFPPQEN